LQKQVTISKENLAELSRWAGLIAIVTIITGSLSAIMGLFALGIGAIPGVIAVFLGLKLRNVKNHADRFLREEEEGKTQEEIDLLIKNLVTYFKIQGILIIIALGVVGFSFISGFLGLLFYY